MERILLEAILPALFAILVVSILHPKLVLVALRKSIVDNPDARRLNKKPVPVLGGVGIFAGVLISVCLFACIYGTKPSFAVLSASVIMLLLGLFDDMTDLRASFKLIVQLLAIAIVMFVGNFRIDSLHGLWGIYALPDWLSISLTLVAGAGVINALNLIDGVDGLSSGYGIITSLICGTVFYMAGHMEFTILCFALTGSLIPFFIHNIFGRKYKMFMGDAGSLVLGLLFAVMIMQFSRTGGLPSIKGIVSFLIAVFSVPVFDTLRVMTMRMLRKRSPFSPDKTHLHHIFIDMGYHHPAATAIILGLDLVLVGIWFVTEQIPAISIDMQFYIVVAAGIFSNMAIYCGIARYRKRHPEKYDYTRRRIAYRQIRRGATLRKLQRMLDGI